MKWIYADRIEVALDVNGNPTEVITEEDREKQRMLREGNKEGCEFCKDGCSNEDNTVSITYDEDGEANLHVVADDPYCGNEVEINYCPFCGRRLRKELLDDLYTKL